VAAGSRFTISATVLSAPDPGALADFYRALLGWTERTREPGWVMISPPDGGTGLSFQDEPDYTAPAWPGGPGDQLMMMHLDIEVDDLAAGCARAEQLGARLAGHQPQDDVRVYLDPAGHPFCLFER